MVNLQDKTFSPSVEPRGTAFNRGAESIASNLRTQVRTKMIGKGYSKEVKWIIRHLKNRKAPGPDGINNRVLKELPDSAVKVISTIINAILALKHFPPRWKEAKIVLLPKPGKTRTDPRNYRPISLLNPLSKLAEKIIFKRFSLQIKNNGIIRNEQHGFRPKHSTTTQLIRHITNIRRGFRGKRSTAGLYLDIERAFDKVWHSGLIRKLAVAVIDDVYIHLINNYLSGRTFFTSVNNNASTVREIRAGVPQGSILGPLLFNLHINDMPHLSQYNNSQLHIYADDTLITGQSLRPEYAVRQIQRNVALLEPWLTKWRIKINVNKCQAVLYTRRTSPALINPPEITMFGTAIPWTAEAKYLGLILDRKLLFGPHIRSVIAKAYSRYRLLLPLMNTKDGLPIKTALLMYKTLLRPIITYASPAWGDLAAYKMAKLQTFQNRVLYRIAQLPRIVSSATLHRELRIDQIGEFIHWTSIRERWRYENHPNPLIAEHAPEA